MGFAALSDWAYTQSSKAGRQANEPSERKSAFSLPACAGLDSSAGRTGFISILTPPISSLKINRSLRDARLISA